MNAAEQGGQSSGELAELERATGEIVREGGSQVVEDAAGRQSPRRALEAREAFEDATDEVSREDE